MYEIWSMGQKPFGDLTNNKVCTKLLYSVGKVKATTLILHILSKHIHIDAKNTGSNVIYVNQHVLNYATLSVHNLLNMA